MKGRGHLFIGTSGWNYREFRNLLYPQKMPVKNWFAHYAREFNTVEINNTFYTQQSPEVYAGWKRQAPSGFVFSIKAHRFLTHRKKLLNAEEILPVVLQQARQLGSHLGPVLYQLPPNWHCDVDRLRDFIGLLPLDIQHVFEFRDHTWYNDVVRNLLTEAGANFCIHDLRGHQSPTWVTGPLVYLRFHGPTENAYVGGYTCRRLRHWAEMIEAHLQERRDVYVYFNNTADGHALVNARELKTLLNVATDADLEPTIRKAR